MKQLYMQTETPKNIKDVFAEKDQVNFNTKTSRMKSSIASTSDWGKGTAIERTDNLSIFLAQNKGKGPPGRSYSAEASRGHPPENKDDFPNGMTVIARSIPISSEREGLGLPAEEAGVSLGHPTTFNNQIQIFNTKLYSNFTNTKFYLS